MTKLLLLDVVGLTPRQIGADTPHLSALAKRGALAPMDTVLPAVTCSAQATMLTGTLPREHGAVGNGWLDPDTMEIGFWRQSNRLVAGEKLYETAAARVPGFTCAKLFWWWNMGAKVDWSITPRPYYPADGRKLLSVYSWPPEFAEGMEQRHGKFPFFDFWGPRSGLPSSRWIADVARDTLREHEPSLTLAYLPHLDYDHQRFGPTDARSVDALRAVDGLVGELVSAADERGVATMVVSEYGIQPVRRSAAPNVRLREAGLLHARPTPAGEVLDVFGSRAFAVCDHQLAHVHCVDDAARAEARAALESLEGVARVLDRDAQREFGIDHRRSGDLVCLSEPDSWFSYYYWLDPKHEPDFARTVDIHRKPGYDPCELFVDPALAVPQLRVARRLLQKKLGMRYLMDVIPIEPGLIRGSHGLLPEDPADGPVFLCSEPFGSCGGDPRSGVVEMTSVRDRALAVLTAN